MLAAASIAISLNIQHAFCLDLDAAFHQDKVTRKSKEGEEEDTERSSNSVDHKCKNLHDLQQIQNYLEERTLT